MRAADPLLAREDDNGLFRAFRSRRMRGTKLLAKHGDWTRPVELFCVHATIQMVAFLLIGGPNALFIGIIVAAGFSGVLAVLCKGAPALPLRLYDSHDPGYAPGSGSPMANDLWLVPVSGSEVLDAMYLEHREASLLSMPRIAILAAALVSGVYLRAVAPPMAELWKEVLPMALLFWLFSRFARVYLLYDDKAMAIHRVKRDVALWDNIATGGGSELRRRAFQPLQLMGAAFIAAIVLIPIVLMVGSVLGPILFPKSLVEFVAANRAFFLAVVLLLILITLEVRARACEGRAVADEFEELRSRADQLYEAYMRRRFLGGD